MPVDRPLVTLTSDFGLADAYVAAMKAAVLRHCPEANLIDITHQVPRHDILAGSIALERAVAAFDEETVHLAVVDPGVGGPRRLAAALVRGQWIVCPDNGLMTWALRRWAPGETFEIIWRPRQSSATFHGRDIMAPVAGWLADAVRRDELLRPMDDPVLLDVHLAQNAGDGRVIHLDGFGNATTNIPAELVGTDGYAKVWAADREIGPLRRTYSDVAPGEALALIGSSGLLEIAVRDGSAGQVLGLRVGDEVHWR
jgi:S-adenosyl-L-methionine hydrolase (adenosine-forming)